MGKAKKPRRPPPAEPGMRRTAKDSLFTSLFSDTRYLIELYRALHPEDADATEADIRNVTIHNVLTDAIYNDLGFLVGDRVVILVEAQSTWSPNILVRALMYLAKTYSAYIEEHGLDVYGSRPVRIPKPEFYVIFTGRRRDCPEELSFRKEFFPGKARCSLDMTATVITGGRPGDIISQYVAFARILDEQVRLHGRTVAALEEAVRICSDKNILRDYLESRRAELMKYIWDWTDEEIEERYIQNQLRKKEEEVTRLVTENVTKYVSAEKARNFALRLLGKGQMSHEDIAECADLPLAEVEELARTQPA